MVEINFLTKSEEKHNYIIVETISQNLFDSMLRKLD